MVIIVYPKLKFFTIHIDVREDVDDDKHTDRPLTAKQ